VCGKSGSGKSAIIRRLGYDGSEPSYDYDKAVISQFPNLDEKEACDLLSSMGLSSVPTWLRKPNEISNGERARLDIAKAIYDSNGGTVYLDEFTSVVNRSSAKSMSYALQRYARKKGLKLVIASCHMDVIEWLQPDYVFNLEHMDENTHVDVERRVYTDDTDYNANQTVRQADILTEAIPIN
jgi:ABC-type ATPase with predicted acetyltransferase domain